MKFIKITLINLVALVNIFAFDNATFRSSSRAQPNTDYNFNISVEDAVSTGLSLPNVLLENKLNLFQNPAELLEEGMIFAEVLKNAGWGGTSLKIKKSVRMGLFFARPYAGHVERFTQAPLSVENPFTIAVSPLPSAPPGSIFASGGGLESLITATASNPNTALFNLFDYFIAFKVLSLDFGLRYSFAYNNDKKEAESNDNSVANGIAKFNLKQFDHTFGIGAFYKGGKILESFSLSTTFSLIGFNFGFDQTQANGSIQVYEGNRDGSFVFSQLVKPVIKIRSTDKLLFPINYTYIDTSSKFTENIVGIENTFGLNDFGHEFSFGMAFHYKKVKNLTLIFASGYNLSLRNVKNVDRIFAGVANNDTIFKTKTIEQKIPASIAAEYLALNWMKVRFGFTKLLFHHDQVKQEELLNSGVLHKFKNTKRRSNDFQMATGLGFMIKDRLDIDLAVSTQTFDLDDLLARVALKFYY